MKTPCCGWCLMYSCARAVLWTVRLSASWPLAITFWSVGEIVFILHLSFVWEDTGVSCYFRFCIMNWECVRPTFLVVVPSYIWKTHGHCSYAKPLSRKIHYVAIIWISLHASNGLHNERYLAFLTTIWNEHNDDKYDCGGKIS